LLPLLRFTFVSLARRRVGAPQLAVVAASCTTPRARLGSRGRKPLAVSKWASVLRYLSDGARETCSWWIYRACLRGWPRVAWPARLGQAWIGLAQMVQSTLFACMFPQSRVESRLCLRPFWESG
jgi:hypothetical protein